MEKAYECVTVNGKVRFVALIGTVTRTDKGFVQSINGRAVATIPDDRIVFIDVVPQ